MWIKVLEEVGQCIYCVSGRKLVQRRKVKCRPDLYRSDNEQYSLNDKTNSYIYCLLLFCLKKTKQLKTNFVVVCSA